MQYTQHCRPLGGSSGTLSTLPSLVRIGLCAFPILGHACPIGRRVLYDVVACSNVLVFKGHVSAFSVADLYYIIDNFCFEPHPRTGETVPNLKTLELISVYVRTLDSRVFLGPSRTFCSERTTQFANLKSSTLRHIANVTAVYACLHYHAAWHCCA